MTDAPLVDLTAPRRIHVVGVGGSGMNAIATVLAEMGHRVTGSDLKDSAGLDRLRSVGVTAHVGHDPSHLPGDAELVAVSTAIPDRNVELAAARERGVPVARRADVLAAIAARRPTIAVAGTHGKTTTASMLSLVLIRAGVHPSFIIGGDVNEIGSGAVWDDDGDVFVVEADESDGTFLVLPTAAAVVTNLDPDHLDHYGSVEALHEAFGRFTSSAGGPVVLPDDGAAASLPAERTVSFGTGEHADVRLVDLRSDRAAASFVLRHEGQDHVVRLPVPGAHNAANAAAAFAAAVAWGVPADVAAEALGHYSGVARRYEFRGEADHITFVDDYAHLPAEVRAATETAVGGGDERVVTVFQPHRYSRTKALWADFADAFAGDGPLVITDVYSAGEQIQPGITGELVARAVREAHPERDVRYVATLADAETELLDELRPGDLCLTLGAGDLTLLPDRLLAARRNRGGGAG